MSFPAEPPKILRGIDALSRALLQGSPKDREALCDALLILLKMLVQLNREQCHGDFQTSQELGRIMVSAKTLAAPAAEPGDPKTRAAQEAIADALRVLAGPGGFPPPRR